MLIPSDMPSIPYLATYPTFASYVEYATDYQGKNCAKESRYEVDVHHAQIDRSAACRKEEMRT